MFLVSDLISWSHFLSFFCFLCLISFPIIFMFLVSDLRKTDLISWSHFLSFFVSCVWSPVIFCFLRLISFRIILFLVYDFFCFFRVWSNWFHFVSFASDLTLWSHIFRDWSHSLIHQCYCVFRLWSYVLISCFPRLFSFSDSSMLYNRCLGTWCIGCSIRLFVPLKDCLLPVWCLTLYQYSI